MSTIRKKSVDLFTPDEHAVLSKWFCVKPPECANCISPSEAAEQPTRSYPPSSMRAPSLGAEFNTGAVNSALRRRGDRVGRTRRPSPSPN
jgi:hypothetical protein